MRNDTEIRKLKDKLKWCRACIKAQAERIRELEREIITLKAKLEE